MTMPAWVLVTGFGDSAVLLPSILVPAFWLALFHATRALVWRWLLVVGMVALIVTISKLIFMVWGIGVSSLAFTGVSGHSAMSATVWPSVLALLGRGGRRSFGSAGAIIGLLFAVVIAASRVVLNAHSWAEVLSGFFLGATAASVFLWKLGAGWHLKGPRWALVMTLLLMYPVICRYRFPSEHLLHVVAKRLSVDNTIHTRRNLGERQE